MRKYLLLFFCSLVSGISAQLNTWSLDTGTPGVRWQVAPERTMADAIDAPVPGTVFTAYVEAGKEACPEYADNIYKVDERKYNRPFWYRTQFALPRALAQGEHLWLCFDNTNRFADFYFNGQKISGTASSEKDVSGHMLRSRFDITNLCKLQGQNVVEVKIYDPDQKKTRTAKDPYGVACSPSYLAGAGWDWMPYVPGRLAGITGHVRLEITRDVSLLDPCVRTLLPSHDKAELTIVGDVANASSAMQQVTVEGTIMPGNIKFRKQISVAAGDTATISVDSRDVASLVINKPCLWWPNGYGDPNLYECKLRCYVNGQLSDTRSVRFGIRQYDYRIVTNDAGYPVLQFYVNGQRVFLKGGNWGMSEYLLRCHGSEYETRIRLHKDMNYNTIRLWTGCVTDDEFYDYCDEQGIMVWNDFWLYVAFNDVAEPEAFIRNARDKVRRLRSHACIALWCGANETHPAPHLDNALRMIVMEEDANQRLYKSCSNQDALSGSGWWKDMPPRHHFETSASNLAFNTPSYPYGNNYGYGMRSEIGMATFPQYESVQLFIPKNQQWPLPSDDLLRDDNENVWNRHFFGREASNADPVSYRQNVDERYGVSRNLQEFCEKAQLINLEDMRGMYEAWQDKMWNDASGLLIWMSHPAYPSFVWQTYDYYLDPTGCYWGARQACEPQHVQWNCLTGSVKVVNTTAQRLTDVLARAEIFGLDGQLLTTREARLDVGASNVKEAFVLDSLPKTELLFIRLKLFDDRENLLSENLYWHNTKRYLDYTQLGRMPEAQLTVTTVDKQTIRLKNNTRHVSFANRLRLVDAVSDERILPVYWSENYVTLMPGEEKLVSFTTEDVQKSCRVMVKAFGAKERGFFVNSSSLAVSNLLCENMEQPLGIDTTTPHFSWQLNSGDNKAKQKAYEIQVATDSVSLLRGDADLWKTGVVHSDNQIMIAYAGSPLSERQLCYWRVRVYDEKNRPSEWSEVQRFSIGCLKGLAGSYIGGGKTPVFCQQVMLDSEKTTFAHINSLGYHELYVNGQRVGDHVLQPAVSQLDRHSLIVTYDITPYINNGVNNIAIHAGQGWYKKNTFKAQYDGPLVKAQIDQLSDGEWQTVCQTNSAWQVLQSGRSDIGTWYPLQFGGERLDAQVANGAQVTTKAEEVIVKGMTATPQMFSGNRIIDLLEPVSITKIAPNQWLFDMGRVITGWVEMSVDDIKAGQEITIDYTDYIPVGGKFESQGEHDVFVTAGGKDEVFSNQFHHHAFRYVCIQSPVCPKVVAKQVSGIDGEASSFECSDPRLNAIHDMIHRTMRCLTISGYMVDCPHLERMGYGGDGNSSTMTLQTMYNVAPTYLNWLTAWGDVMEADGSLPYVAPAGGGGGGPYWSGFMVQAPWRTYLNYADSRPMERLFDKMNLWLDYVERYTVDGLLQPWPDTENRMWFLGDWLAPDGVDVGGESPLLVNNCFISECLNNMAKMARVMGRNAKPYEQRRDKLNRRIHEVFYHADSKIYGTGSPLDMTYPMLVGAVPANIYNEVKEQLLNRSRTVYNNHIAVGLVGVPIFTEWCTKNAEADLMYDLLKQPDYPGYLHMINNGATTTWEYWNGERSRVHNCYNGIGTWFYQALAGITPDSQQPGYRHMTIRPQQPKGLDWVKASLPTPYGKVSVEWNEQTLCVKLPIGTTADVVWGNQVHKVSSGEWRFNKN